LLSLILINLITGTVQRVSRDRFSLYKVDLLVLSLARLSWLDKFRRRTCFKLAFLRLRICMVNRFEISCLLTSSICQMCIFCPICITKLCLLSEFFHLWEDFSDIFGCGILHCVLDLSGWSLVNGVWGQLFIRGCLGSIKLLKRGLLRDLLHLFVINDVKSCSDFLWFSHGDFLGSFRWFLNSLIVRLGNL